MPGTAHSMLCPCRRKSGRRMGTDGEEEGGFETRPYKIEQVLGVFAEDADDFALDLHVRARHDDR